MYNKIFTKILDSSIWLETNATRIVWLTFIAAMDEEGFASFASVANLAHRAIVPVAEAEEAVWVLESPDKNSSDPDNDGRRIERVPGGWIVLNASKYREISTRALSQQKTRSRVAEFRARKRSGIDEIIRAQDSKCVCCREPFESPFKLYVVQDHNHTTGRRRGLICQSCNKVVGFIESGRNTDHPKTKVCSEYLARYAESNGGVTGCNGLVTPSETDAETKAEAPNQALLALGMAKQPTPQKPKTERPRNELFDALCEVEGSNPSEINGKGGEIAKALRLIKQSTPEVTPDEIKRRAANYRSTWPKATLTASALAKHWAKFGNLSSSHHATHQPTNRRDCESTRTALSGYEELDRRMAAGEFQHGLAGQGGRPPELETRG